MKLLVAKSDLLAALNISEKTLTGSGTGITTHFVFRLVETEGQPPHVEVLSHGGRTFSAVPLTPVTLSETSTGNKTFSVEGRRFKNGLDLLGDVAVTLEATDNLVTLTVPGIAKPFRFLSLDPYSQTEKFPFWDDLLTTSKVTAHVPANRLHAALAYAKDFISTEEAKNPGMCVTEVRDGILYASDRVGAVLLAVAGLEQATLRVHGRDLGPVLAFLADAGEEEIEVLEHPTRAVLFRRRSGAVLGESRPTAAFPPMPGIDRLVADHHFWVLPKDDLIRGIKLVRWTAADDDKKLRLNRPDPNGPVVLSMLDKAGKTAEVEIPVIEAGKRTLENGEVDPNVPDLPESGFVVSYDPLLKILNSMSEDKLRLGLSRRKQTGFVRYQQQQDGDDYVMFTGWL